MSPITGNIESVQSTLILKNRFWTTENRITKSVRRVNMLSEFVLQVSKNSLGSILAILSEEREIVGSSFVPPNIYRRSSASEVQIHIYCTLFEQEIVVFWSRQQFQETISLICRDRNILFLYFGWLPEYYVEKFHRKIYLVLQKYT